MPTLGGIASALLRPPADVAGRLTLRSVDLVLAWPVTEEALGRILDSPLMERLPRRLADRLLAEGIADEIAERLLDGPELERIVARLLESSDLWLLVDGIARSESVRNAISNQSVGFAEELAGEVRVRSQAADARVERLARRLLRRESADSSDH